MAVDHPIDYYAEQLVDIVGESGTYDAAVVGESRREVKFPVDIVVVLETRTVGDVVTLLDGTIFRLTSQDTSNTDQEWILKGVVGTGDSFANWTIYCALSGEYESNVWYYTGSEAEVQRLERIAIAQGNVSLDMHGLFDGASVIAATEADIYSTLSLTYKEPNARTGV